MHWNKPLMFFVAAAVSFTSCSGPKTVVCREACGGGNANLSLTLSDTPPANTSILSFTLPVSGIALVPSGGGSPISVFSSQNFELTRLQSDTNLIAANMPVAAGTYTAVNVTVAAPSGVIINSSGATVGTCAAGNVCNITGSAATITYTFLTPLVLTANANQWLNLDFNYSNAIVTATGNIDVTQSSVLTASATLPIGIPSGDFANIDDFTGAVTAISTSSITIKSTARGSLTASTSSTTPVYDPQNQCKNHANPVSCLPVGSIVSLQGVLTNAGIVNATSIDLIDSSATPA